jgi:hypothetical protein
LARSAKLILLGHLISDVMFDFGSLRSLELLSRSTALSHHPATPSQDYTRI